METPAVIGSRIFSLFRFDKCFFFRLFLNVVCVETSLVVRNHEYSTRRLDDESEGRWSNLMSLPRVSGTCKLRRAESCDSDGIDECSISNRKFFSGENARDSSKPGIRRISIGSTMCIERGGTIKCKRRKICWGKIIYFLETWN